MTTLASDDPEVKFARVLGQRIAYVEIGTGDPIVFLHGNPVSSRLWRHIQPQLATRGRCIAPDLMGMGRSGKLAASGPASYRFADHYRYLAEFLEVLGIRERVTLVLHDWGSALGFHWAREHPESVARIAYMEAIVRPLSWAEWPTASRALFQALRSPAGEALILEKNVFIERILPGSIQRALSAAELAAYREPFLNPGEDRRPMLSWPRELPIEGEPADVVGIVQAYADWMAANTLPKLFVNAEPGAILVGAQREFCRGWLNQVEVTVPGIHFIQEDSPDEIAAALVSWIEGTG
ncbi:MAG: haloalkane dehalogenase [Gammaproteobacteria bacterium]